MGASSPATGLRCEPNQFQFESQDQQIRMLAGPGNHLVIHKAGTLDSGLLLATGGGHRNLFSFA
jgi:hypothetical protein